MKLSTIIATKPERISFLIAVLGDLNTQTYRPDETLIITDAGEEKSIGSHFFRK